MASELITFEVEKQRFGIDIMAVREIRAWTPTTRLPSVPSYVDGVINLRGTVLPVVNLAARLGWPGCEPTPRHVIVVTEFEGRMCGWIVDAVSDIIAVPEEGLQSPPATAESDVLPFLHGMVANESCMIMVLSLQALSLDERLELAA